MSYRNVNAFADPKLIF